MNRSALSILAIALAAGALSGCTTFSDNDAIARVGDTELGESTLTSLLSILPEATGSGGPSSPDSGDDVRQAIGVWVQAQAQRQELDRRGIVIPATDRDATVEDLDLRLPGFTELDDPTRNLLIDFVAGQPALAGAPIDAASVAPIYARGPIDSGIACVSHILVDSAADAADVIAALDDGADFAVLAAERSADAGSAENGGSLGCWFTAEMRIQFVPEFADGAASATIGVPTEPVETTFGYHVIRLQPFDEAIDDLGPVVNSPRFLVGQADVHVDPRYGEFDPAAGIVPVGA